MLYHLSFDVLETIEEFVPRIPDQRIEGEDDTSLRICCSDSIENALVALPNNADFLSSTKLFPLIKVYELDETKVEGSNLLTPELIQDKVSDALVTKEHWITTNIKPSNFYIIQVTNMDYDESSKTINELKYYKVNQNEETKMGSYYCFNIKVEVSEETLMILDDKTIKDDDIYDVKSLLSKANKIIENAINYVSYEPEFSQIHNDNGFELNVDGYFEGEYREFIHQEKDVIDGIKKELITLVSQYKLSVAFL